MHDQEERPLPPGAVTMVGHRWARHAHELRDFLAANRIPYRWLDMDRGDGAANELAVLGATEAPLPVVALPDGTVLHDPALETLAEALGMHVHAESRGYDLGIVGAGPAGLAAAVYGGSEGLSTIVVEGHAPGGQAGTSSRIENYLGFPDGVSGPDLTSRAVAQARKFGVEIVAPQAVEGLEVRDAYKVLHLGDGSTLWCRALVIASGVSYRTLATPGLARLAGAGVYYGAATTEATDAEGEHVYVVGSSNSAGQGAVYFSRLAARVTVICRSAALGDHMSSYLVDQIDATPNIDVITNAHVIAAEGETHLASITVEDVSTKETTSFATEFLFVFVGAEPMLQWLRGQVAVDSRGYVLCGPDLAAAGAEWPLERNPFHLETSIPGVFCAGDARHGSIRRVAGAVGEGATCTQLVHRYLAEHP